MILRPRHRRQIKQRLHAMVLLEFIFGVVYGIFSLTLPLLAESIFANLALLGVIFALPEIIGTAIDIPIGSFARRFGRRKTIFYSGVLLGLSAIAFTITKNQFIFVAVLIFYETATQSFIIPGDAEETALTPARTTGHFNALLEGFHNLGFSFGPVIAGVVIGYYFNYAYWIALLLSCLMMVIATKYLPAEKHTENFGVAIKHVVTRDKVMGAGFSEFRRLGFGGLFIAFIFFSFALHWGFIALMEPLYAREIGLTEWQTGLIYAAFTIPIFFVCLFVGNYIDRHGAKGVTIVGLTLHALSAFGFALTIDPIRLFILALVSGVGDALILPAIFTLFDHMSSYHKKEHISGIKMFGESLGYFAGPLIAGILGSTIGYAGTFMSLGAFLLILTLATTMIPLGVTRQKS